MDSVDTNEDHQVFNALIGRPEPLQHFEGITKEHLDEMVSVEASESQTLDFKKELNLGVPKEKKEVGKDISGMANAHGGVIIYGVEEEKRNGNPVAAKIHPIDNAHEIADRLHKVISTGITPSYQPNIRVVEIENGGVILVRAHRNPGALLFANGYERYYRRYGTNCNPMSPQDVEEAFKACLQTEKQLEQKIKEIKFESTLNPKWSMNNQYGTLLPQISVVTIPVNIIDRHIVGLENQQEADEFFGACNQKVREQLKALGHSYIELPRVERHGEGWFSVSSAILRVRNNGVCEHVERRISDRIDQESYGYQFVVEGKKAYTVRPLLLVNLVINSLLWQVSVLSGLRYFGEVICDIRLDAFENVHFTSSNSSVPEPAPLIDETYSEIKADKWITMDQMLYNPGPVIKELLDGLWRSLGRDECPHMLVS